MTEKAKVDDGHVVTMHYTLRVNGEIVDSSDADEPLMFIQGMGHIIPGLEQQLYEMHVGDKKKVSVAPKDGYGVVDAAAFMEVPRSAFPKEVPMKVGTQLELKDKSGHPTMARIESVTAESIRLDMNHPLAGKQLDFEVTIASLRPATEEEVSHGHVHEHGGH